jgi:uncharacterized protein YebE (UPF0316 family)
VRTIISALATGGAAACSISLWTFRVALANRGRRGVSSVIAGIEAVLFVLIFTGLVANLGDPVRILGYALGVAGGTFLGLFADERLSAGQSEIRLILAGDGAGPIDRLLRAGWPATWTAGAGPAGPTTTVTVVVDDREIARLLALVDRLRPVPFVTVERLRTARPVPLPGGFTQVAGSRGASRPRGRARAGAR